MAWAAEAVLAFAVIRVGNIGRCILRLDPLADQVRFATLGHRVPCPAPYTRLAASVEVVVAGRGQVRPATGWPGTQRCEIG